MTDKMQLDDIAVLTALREAGATEKELAILTYESGPYEITKPTVFMQKLASVLAAKSVPVVPEHIRSIKIPTDAMEQEFQHHYRRGYEAGKASNNAELERLRKDAERYRWLRDGNDTKKSAACHIAVNCYGLEWDTAIDAAIARAAAIGEGVK